MRLLFVLPILACHTQFPENAPSLKITDNAFGTQHAKRTVRFEMPFELQRGGLNGTELVMTYLSRAEQVGARYASDLSITLQFTYQNHAMECVSRVAIDDGNTPRVPVEPPPSVTDDEFTTTVKPWRPDEVNAMVVDPDLSCHKHGELVISQEPDYETRYDVTVPRKLNPGYMPTHEEGTIVWSNECARINTMHRVHRYAHFVATHFMPPDWEKIAKRFSDWKLVEEPPQCHTFERVSGEPLRQSVRGTIHFTGQNGKRKYPLAETQTDMNWTPCLTDC